MTLKSFILELSVFIEKITQQKTKKKTGKNDISFFLTEIGTLLWGFKMYHFPLLCPQPVLEWTLAIKAAIRFSTS